MNPEIDMRKLGEALAKEPVAYETPVSRTDELLATLIEEVRGLRADLAKRDRNRDKAKNARRR